MSFWPSTPATSVNCRLISNFRAQRCRLLFPLSVSHVPQLYSFCLTFPWALTRVKPKLLCPKCRLGRAVPDQCEGWPRGRRILGAHLHNCDKDDSLKRKSCAAAIFIEVITLIDSSLELLLKELHRLFDGAPPVECSRSPYKHKLFGNLSDINISG